MIYAIGITETIYLREEKSKLYFKYANHAYKVFELIRKATKGKSKWWYHKIYEWKSIKSTKICEQSTTKVQQISQKIS